MLRPFLDSGRDRTASEDKELAEWQLYLDQFKRNYPRLVPHIPPDTMLNQLIQDQGLNEDDAQLIKIFRSRRRIRSVLHGQEMTVEEAKKLGRLFQVSPTNFIP